MKQALINEKNTLVTHVRLSLTYMYNIMDNYNVAGVGKAWSKNNYLCLYYTFFTCRSVVFFHYHDFVRVFDSHKAHVNCTLDLSKVCICFHPFWRNISIIMNTSVPKLLYINSQERKKSQIICPETSTASGFYTHTQLKHSTDFCIANNIKYPKW